MNLKRNFAIVALTASVVLSAQPADARLVIHCDRGPIPSNPMINGHDQKFVDSLLDNFVMTERDAIRVARSVCGNMGAVGDLDYLIDLTLEATAKFPRKSRF